LTATTLTGVDAEAQFAELLERHRGIVFKVAATYCRNPADREDVAQEIVTQLWRAFPTYDAARTFSTWMYRIALNVAISFVRTNSVRARHTVALDETQDVEDPTIARSRRNSSLAVLVHRSARRAESSPAASLSGRAQLSRHSRDPRDNGNERRDEDQPLETTLRARGRARASGS
jgi:RNA polymerase sigma factor (sigma-70 family)